MLSREDNELLTQTGPGTPMGELFRRFWLPVMLSEEIPAPDCTPVKVRVLGEDLIAFRDSSGNPGLVDAYCPHRGAPMFFGRNEDAGLRCVYHGWKFDVSGQCVELPNVPEGETHKERVRIPAYPVHDRAGMIFAYLGPAEKQPPFPEHEWIDLPEDRRYVRKYLLQCNYKQAMEGDYDGSHVAFLHSTLDSNISNPGNRIREGQISVRNKTPRYVDMTDTDYGMMFVTEGVQDDGRAVINVGHWLMPCASTAGIAGPNTQSTNIRVPIDDNHCWMYRFRWSDDPFTQNQVFEDRYGGYTYPEQIPGQYLSKANKDNDYLIDRIAQKNISFTGIGPFPIQDLAMMEDQRGSIMDRSKEHLVSSDSAIIRVRQHLLNAARALRQGVEPVEPWRPGAYRVRTVRTMTVPEGQSKEAVIATAKELALRNQDDAVHAR
ncbi:MAG: Rieske 2Fe-2S domain-containing protein [Chloroflexota bacterium]